MLKYQNCKILTLFAHPDDETLSAGGTLAKLSQDNEITVAIPATGLKARDKEDYEIDQLRTDCESALYCLGVQHIKYGEFADNQMDKYPRLEIFKWFESVIQDVKPDLIFTHHRYCTNIDHQRCHEASVVSTRPDVEKHIVILCGEVPSSTGYLHPVQFDATCYSVLTKEHIEKKIQAMNCYISERREYPHPRSTEIIEALAKVRGSEAGAEYAEAFVVQRSYI